MCIFWNVNLDIVNFSVQKNPIENISQMKDMPENRFDKVKRNFKTWIIDFY